MFFFGVVKMVNQGTTRMYDRITRGAGGNVVSYVVEQESSRPEEENNEPKGHELVFWSEHERAAQQWANAMAQKFPGSQYATFAINNVYSAVIAEVVERKFDPQKGLLPK